MAVHIDSGETSLQSLAEKRTVELNERTYKYCFVPQCTNTSIRTPNKIFLSVPKDPKRRNLWTKAARRESDVRGSGVYCCEDHVDLRDDAENYMEYVLVGCAIKLKPTIIPHKFNCQEKGKTAHDVADRAAFRKRLHVETVSEAINNVGNSHAIEEYVEQGIQEQTCGIGAQTEKIKSERFRSKFVKPKKLKITDVFSVATLPLNNQSLNVGTSPIKWTNDSNEDVESLCTFEETTNENTNHDFFPSESDDDDEEDQASFKLMCLDRTRFLVRKYCMLFLGIPKDYFFIIDKLAEKIIHKSKYLTANDIVCLVLKKIRVNTHFSMLCLEFGISESYAFKLFVKFTPIIACQLEELII